MYKQKRSRQHYPVELQMQILNEAEREPVAVVAERYGLNTSAIYSWRKRDIGSLATAKRSPVRAATSLVRVERIPEASRLRADLAEANSEVEILQARCKHLEWLVGKMVSTHPDLAKFTGERQAHGRNGKRASA